MKFELARYIVFLAMSNKPKLEALKLYIMGLSKSEAARRAGISVGSLEGVLNKVREYGLRPWNCDEVRRFIEIVEREVNEAFESNRDGKKVVCRICGAIIENDPRIRSMHLLSHMKTVEKIALRLLEASRCRSTPSHLPR